MLDYPVKPGNDEYGGGQPVAPIKGSAALGCGAPGDARPAVDTVLPNALTGTLQTWTFQARPVSNDSPPPIAAQPREKNFSAKSENAV